MAIRKGKTQSGFEFVLEENALNNMELVDAIAVIDSSEDESEILVAVSQACLFLLGKAQRKKLYDFLRDPDGRVPTEKVGHAINEIFTALGDETKK